MGKDGGKVFLGEGTVVRADEIDNASLDPVSEGIRLIPLRGLGGCVRGAVYGFHADTLVPSNDGEA